MFERLNIIASNIEPENKHVLWLKGSMLRRHLKGAWKPINLGDRATDYTELNNIPSINGVPLVGDVDGASLGIVANTEHTEIFDYTSGDTTVAAGTFERLNKAVNEKRPIAARDKDGFIQYLDYFSTEAGILLCPKPTYGIGENNELVKITSRFWGLYNDDTIRSTVAFDTDIPSKTSQLTNDSNFTTTTYVDTKIANLVGTAPETLDTLGELAVEFQKNSNVVTALDASITTKLSKTEAANTYQPIGDYNDSYIAEWSASGTAQNNKVYDLYTAYKAGKVCYIKNTDSDTSDGMELVLSFIEGKGPSGEPVGYFFTMVGANMDKYPTFIHVYRAVNYTSSYGYFFDIQSSKIPQSTSDLTNDSGFITSADIPEVDTSDFLTESDFKTVNGQSIVGTGNITIEAGIDEIPVATSSVIGGIKLGYTASGKNYPVVLDANNKAYVNVPWTDTQADLTSYATQTWVNSQGFLKTVPTEYITETELTQKGYLTAIPSEYITETELNSKNYLTAVPAEYITETELNAKGYLTSVPEATTTTAGLMSAEDKTKLDNLTSAGIQKVTSAQYTAMKEAGTLDDNVVYTIIG